MVVEAQSTTSAPGSDAGTLTLTKPAGLIVGELLAVVLVSWDVSGGINTGTWATLATWSSAVGQNYNNNIAQSIQYKVATSGDVAASDFTFTHSSSERLRGTILRCSGNNTVDGGLGVTDVASNFSANSASFNETITSYTPPVDGALIIMQVAGDQNSTGAFTITDYAAAGGTFTEAYNSAYSAGGVVGAAYGIQGTSTAITAYTATFNSSMIRHYGQLAVFNPPVNASGSNTLATTTSATLVQSGTCDTIGGTNVLTEGNTETFEQTGVVTSPTQWTNEAKPSTTWVNETK